MAMSFAASIRLSRKATMQRVDNAACMITRELFRLVIERTPVYQGVLVNNWNAAINSFDENITSRPAPKRVGPTRRMEAVIKTGTFLNRDTYVTLTNALDYAFRAEYLGWPAPPKGEWSGTIGPYAMVRTSLHDISKITNLSQLSMSQALGV